MFQQNLYSQTRIKETRRAVRKEFVLSIVSFMSCPIITKFVLHKSGGVKTCLISKCFLSVFLLSEFDCLKIEISLNLKFKNWEILLVSQVLLPKSCTHSSSTSI